MSKYIIEWVKHMQACETCAEAEIGSAHGLCALGRKLYYKAGLHIK